VTDFTVLNLEAALLDQIVAGRFFDKPYAFVAVIGDDGWQLGVAVANQNGYTATSKTFTTETEAREWADGLNRHIGIAKETEIRIIVSTMGGMSFQKWETWPATHLN
jgi:hypothetical protein